MPGTPHIDACFEEIKKDVVEYTARAQVETNPAIKGDVVALGLAYTATLQALDAARSDIKDLRALITEHIDKRLPQEGDKK